MRFGTFRFDRDRRQVRHADEDVHLTRKAFDLLALLIEEAPRVVPKSELHERLWPRTFVSDSALAGLVKELRRVLRERGSDESYIRTSHGVGYAFAGESETGAQGTTPAAIQHWVVAGDRRIPLCEGENFVGRDPSSQVWLDAVGVSRRHARILVRGDRAEIEDLGSKNGTVARSVPVAESVTLCDGDNIDVGPVSILYRAAGAGMSTATTIRRT